MQEFLRRFWFLLMVILAVSLALPSRAFAQSSDLPPNPVAEQWVWEQIALGRIADLQSQFPNEEDRVLSAEFLVNTVLTPPIEVTPNSVRIQNAVFVEPLSLDYLKVDHHVWLEDCKFYGGVYLYKSDFTGDLHFRGSTFSSAVDLGSSKIGGNLDAREAKFLDSEQGAYFNNMTVSGNVFLSRAVFAGGVDFSDVQIRGFLEASNAYSSNEAGQVSFRNMKVDGTAYLHETGFAGSVDFIGATIGGDLDAREANFLDPEQGAYFNNMTVSGNVFLSRAVFAGPVSFDLVEVKNDFVVVDAEFRSTTRPSFNEMIVRHETLFARTKFKQGADFENAVFLDLTIHDISISNLSFDQATVERNLRLYSLEVQNLDSRSFIVYGLTEISDVNFLNYADFENSQFGDLHVVNVTWPAGSENINLRGMSYQDFQITREPNEGDSWKELITLIDRSSYDVQVYTTLEKYFLQRGDTESADAVYIAYKQRERTLLAPGSMGWLSNWLLQALFMYGREPGLAFTWSVVIIILGWVVFRKPDDMVSLSKREIIGPKVGRRGTLSRKVPMRIVSSQHEVTYNPLWYSLDLFIPFLDLGFDDKWAPRPNRKWALIYAKLHMLAGWVLIPIGLLAVTGVIK